MTMSSKNKLPKSYREAADELQSIVEELQAEALDVDLLAEHVRRARQLIEFCQLRLRNTEEEVRSLMSSSPEGHEH